MALLNADDAASNGLAARLSARARACAICRCWREAMVSPHQASFVKLASNVASGSWRMISSPNASS